MRLEDAQQFVELGSKITGYRLKIADPTRRARSRKILALSLVPTTGCAIARGESQSIEAAKLEKVVLFLYDGVGDCGAFNIANTLFISVVQRYRDISVLKTLGAPIA